MARAHLTPRLGRTEEAVTVLFCLVDDAYRLLNPRGRGHESLKSLSDSEVLTLALLQQLRGVESERSFLREAERFFSHLFPGVAGLWPSSFNRRVRKLRRFLEPLRRSVVPDLAGDPETLIVDSTLLAVLHPRQVERSAGWGGLSSGASWARWGSFAVYGAKLHLVCSANRVPLSYELTSANAADVGLVVDLLEDARLGGGTARRLFGDLAYRSGALGEALARRGVALATERADRRPSRRQQIEVCFAALDEAVELVNLRLIATVPVDKPELDELPPEDDAEGGRREANFGGDSYEVPVLDRGRMGEGSEVEGPAIVEFRESTCVVRPGWRGVVGGVGTLVLEKR